MRQCSYATERVLFTRRPIFVSRFVQAHVRVYRDATGLAIELWSHRGPAKQRLLKVERLALAGKPPRNNDEDSAQHVLVAAQSPVPPSEVAIQR